MMPFMVSTVQWKCKYSVFSDLARNESILCVCFQLGVNGYAFIVTNNGFLLSHPDLRPVVCIYKNKMSRLTVIHFILFLVPGKYPEAIVQLG